MPFGVLYVGADRKRIYDAYSKRDMTALVEDLFEGDLIKSIAWQQNPIQRLWVLTDSGKVRVLTISWETEVLAWAKVEFAAGVEVKAIATTYGAEEGSALWLAAQRGEVEVIEVLVDPEDRRHDDRCYLDSSVVRITDGNGRASNLGAHLRGAVTAQKMNTAGRDTDARQETDEDLTVVADG